MTGGHPMPHTPPADITGAQAQLLRDLADEWAANPDAWGDNGKDYRNELRDRADALDASAAAQQDEQQLTGEQGDATLVRLGFERRYYLCGHPAWPDPLRIWPPTAEHAERTFLEHPHPDAYVLLKWELGPRTIVHGPTRNDTEASTR
ncbi:hypothetical protein [Curtobacterium sp. MCBD17_040]|uniref:hypothetical protein n=1 Tax=Curtobacterium sp. MCBD17_040 TaxID=2175674 RepID=UPI0011B7565A|nr:hypothetical protein [Curtobacterium sp. MCBD17_040]WIB65804.1 hypothetical protein DEI94_16960 [Curtobacterium sp. MCBD17_040]